MSDTTRVELPPGCAGLDLPDGTIARPQESGGAVEIPTRYATAGLVSALGLARVGIGFVRAPMGPDSAVCGSCGFHRFAWSDRPDICPRCGRQEPGRLMEVDLGQDARKVPDVGSIATIDGQRYRLMVVVRQAAGWRGVLERINPETEVA